MNWQKISTLLKGLKLSSLHTQHNKNMSLFHHKTINRSDDLAPPVDFFVQIISTVTRIKYSIHDTEDVVDDNKFCTLMLMLWLDVLVLQIRKMDKGTISVYILLLATVSPVWKVKGTQSVVDLLLSTERTMSSVCRLTKEYVRIFLNTFSNTNEMFFFNNKYI